MMSTCSRAGPHCFILTEACPSYHVDWNWPISPEKYLKIDWSVKNAVSFAFYGSYRLLVMDFGL